jgi:bacillithiol biosynthesis deacetylase BshB1
MKIDLLAFGAHPDDVEISCAGTLIKHKALGKTTGIVDLTRGELGSKGSAEIRAEEAAKASQIMGVDVRVNLGLEDGFFQWNKASLLKVVEQIRRFQPEIVIAPATDDRHPDHARGSKLVSDAVFYAGLSKIQTSYEGQEQQAWRAKAVYHYPQDRLQLPDVVIDITPYFEKKMEAIMAYGTQFYNPNDNTPSTPISSKEFFEYMKARSVVAGRPIQVMYAESFTVERAVGVHSLFDLL